MYSKKMLFGKVKKKDINKLIFFYSYNFKTNYIITYFLIQKSYN